MSSFLAIPGLKKLLQSADLAKHHAAVSLALGALALKKSEVNVEIDYDLKRKLIDAAGLAGLDKPAFKTQLDKQRANWDSASAKELVDSMGFINETFKLLHDAQLDSAVLHLQAKGLRLGVLIRASPAAILKTFIPF